MTERQARSLLDQIGVEWNRLGDKMLRGEYVNSIDDRVLWAYRNALQIILNIAHPEIYLSDRTLYLEAGNGDGDIFKDERVGEEPGVAY